VQYERSVVMRSGRPRAHGLQAQRAMPKQQMRLSPARSGAEVSGGRAGRSIDFRRSRSSRRSSPAPRGLPTSGSALKPSRAVPAPGTLAHAHARHARACKASARLRSIARLSCAPISAWACARRRGGERARALHPIRHGGVPA
jgi:hypothetical protein